MSRRTARQHAQQALSRVVDTVVDTGQAWASRLRLRAFFWVLGIALATTAAIMLTSISWVPMVGVAVAAAAMSLSKLASPLSRPTCMTCGKDLSGQQMGNWGAVCPTCGAVHMPRPTDVPGARTEAGVSDEGSADGRG